MVSPVIRTGPIHLDGKGRFLIRIRLIKEADLSDDWDDTLVGLVDINQCPDLKKPNRKKLISKVHNLMNKDLPDEKVYGVQPFQTWRYNLKLVNEEKSYGMLPKKYPLYISYDSQIDTVRFQCATFDFHQTNIPKGVTWSVFIGMGEKPHEVSLEVINWVEDPPEMDE